MTEDRQGLHPLGVPAGEQETGSAREAVNDMLDAGLHEDIKPCVARLGGRDPVANPLTGWISGG